jgi:hypothetical protein
MPPIPGFCSGSYTLQSSYIDSERAVNLYCERPESPAAKSQITLLHTPGLKVAYSLETETSVPCEFQVNGRAFTASANFWEILNNGTTINYGPLNGQPLSPTQILDNQTHLLILSNGNLYIYVLTGFTDSNSVVHAAGSFFPVDMTQFNGPVLQIGFIDGYFIATIQNSNTFQVSNLEDGTTWDGLFISTISYFPDNIVSMVCDHREIQFSSAKKTVWYYNAGGGFPPFIPIQGAFMEEGSAATFSVVQANNTVAWLAQDERGGITAKTVGQYVGQRISTFATEAAWQSYPTVADAVSYSYQEEGHIFWNTLFPTAEKFWSYDFATSLWHERDFFFNGKSSSHRSMSHMFVFGKHLVGDPRSGNIYEMSVNILDDFGNPIRRNRRCPDTTNENKWVYFPRVEFDIEVGLGPIAPLLDGDGQPRAPQCVVSWSNDAGKTFGTEYTLDCGKVGEYGGRVYKSMTGRGRRRVWDWSATDPIPWRIAGAFRVALCEGQEI